MCVVYRCNVMVVITERIILVCSEREAQTERERERECSEREAETERQRESESERERQRGGGQLVDFGEGMHWLRV